jgi:uncharacterized phage infection (PIP) family protein YhgE
MTELQAKLLLHAHHKTLPAKNAQPDPQDHQDRTETLDHQAQTASQEPQDKEAAKDHQDHLDQPALQETMDSPDLQDSQARQDKTEPAQHLPQDQKDLLDNQDPPDPLDRMETQANQVAKDLQDPQASLASPVNQAETVNQDKRAAMDCQDPTRRIAPAPSERAFLCLVSEEHFEWIFIQLLSLLLFPIYNRIETKTDFT